MIIPYFSPYSVGGEYQIGTFVQYHYTARSRCIPLGRIASSQAAGAMRPKGIKRLDPYIDSYLHSLLHPMQGGSRRRHPERQQAKKVKISALDIPAS